MFWGDWKKTLIGLFGLALIIGIAYSFQAQQPIVSKPDATTYILERSEGNCSTDDECEWAGEGCGGGHGLCTNQPEKYEDSVTTCDVNPNFPANKGYTCGCVETIGKCGWIK